MNTKRHKVFVSYHHANDQYYREEFEKLFVYNHDIMLTNSVQMGDINPNLRTETIRQKIRDEYLRDSTVTIVLIGTETWKRKHVDWEIGSSIRDTFYNPRSGLLGIFLPSYPLQQNSITNNCEYYPYTIPPRLEKNVECGYAKVYSWSNDPDEVQNWIHEAFLNRNRIIPNNSFPTFRNNRSGERWYY